MGCSSYKDCYLSFQNPSFTILANYNPSNHQITTRGKINRAAGRDLLPK
jgi:hypothetical protein